MLLELLNMKKKTYDVLLNKEVVMKKVRTIKKLIKIIGN